MKPIMQTTLGAVSACLLSTGAAMASPRNSPSAGVDRPLPTLTNGGAKPIAGTPIVLRAQPGTEADRIGRQLMAREIAKSAQSGEPPSLLVATARLGKSRDSDLLFVQIQSPRDFGSAGCDTASFRLSEGKWVRILDTVSGTIRVSTTRHKGMRDLIVQETDRRIWDGQKYANTVPIPPVDLPPPGTLVSGRWT